MFLPHFLQAYSHPIKPIEISLGLIEVGNNPDS